MTNGERDKEFQRIVALRNAEFARTLVSFASDADLRRMLSKLAEVYEAEAAGLSDSIKRSEIKKS